jgi:hypothetical protein
MTFAAGISAPKTVFSLKWTPMLANAAVKAALGPVNLTHVSMKCEMTSYWWQTGHLESCAIPKPQRVLNVHPCLRGQGADGPLHTAFLD